MPIETVPLTTLDGLQLEADLALQADPVAAGVVCHPHPQHGGDRFNSVVDAVFHALAARRVLAVRFDFRGVNDSQGSFDHGVGERLDVAAAIDVLTHLRPDVPLWVVGYSFGAMVALDVVHPAVHGWVAVAPPLAMAPTPRLAGTDHRPKHVLVPRHDQFGPPDAVLPVLDTWPNTTVDIVESADHFLLGHTAEVGAVVARVIAP